MKWRTGDYLAGQEHASESRRLARISGNLLMEAEALHIESLCWYSLGGYIHSVLLGNRAKDLLCLCGMSGGDLANQIWSDQAEVHRLKSEYIEARNIQTQILRNVSLVQHPYDHALTSLTLAQIDVEISASRDDVTYRNIDVAKECFRTMGYSLGISLCDTTTAALEMDGGDLLKASCLFQTCLKSAWVNYTETASYCLERLGNTSLWPGIDHTSSNWTVVFLAHSLKLKQKLEIHKALQFLGDVYITNGEEQTGVNLFTVALERFTQMDVHRSRAECMLRLGDIFEMHGDLPKAADRWNTARALFERSSQAKKVVCIDGRLAKMSKLWEPHREPFVQLLALNAPTTCPALDGGGEDDVKPALIPA
ncbi:hypothetical protein FB451DRAFT_1170499 [Mycena latifolia]|nr:hypothetical protein FB451DRAFT_1170499 [Mycena latifolia]